MVTATILEVKEKLSGERHEFASALLAHTPDEVVSLYILPRDGGLGGVPLQGGTRSLGYFWPARPYNIYHAVDSNGQTLVVYINLSDRTVITAETITWRDLVVDLVITPEGQCSVLDEDELPDDIDPALLAEINAARDDLLATYPAVIAELERRTAAILA